VASAKAFRKEVVAKCKAAGWRVEQGGSHTKLYPPDGGRPVILSLGTGSTAGRAFANIKAQLRRNGIEI